MCQVEAVLEEGIVCRDLVSIRCPKRPKLEDQIVMLLSIDMLGNGLF